MEKIEQVAQIIVQRGIVLKGARVKDDLAGIGVFSYRTEGPRVRRGEPKGPSIAHG